MTNTMLRWPADEAAICERIFSVKNDLKIVLKTRNETEFLERWILHHLRIAGPKGLVIFDNGSSAPAVLDIYARYHPLVEVFGWDLNHNLIHDPKICRPLYLALQASCRHFTFLDTDELAGWTDGVRLIEDGLDGWLANDDEGLVYPGMWWQYLPGSAGVYIPGIDLTWGKPVVSSSVDLDFGFDGEIIHNMQLIQRHSGLRLRGGLVVCHHSMDNAERRIRVNIDKIIANRFATNGEEVETIIASDNIEELSPNIYRFWVQEIVRCRAGIRTHEPTGILERMHIAVEANGRLRFGSPEIANALKDCGAGRA